MKVQLLLATAAALTAWPLHAYQITASEQVPVPPTSAFASIADEGATVTTKGSVTYRYGTPMTSCQQPAADGCWTPPVTTIGPVTIKASNDLAGDPAVGIGKHLQVTAVRQAQMVTVNGTDKPLPTDPCALPVDSVINLPANRYPSCHLPANGFQIAVDGDKVQVRGMGAPLYFMYCWGTVCNGPAYYVRNRVSVQAGNMWLGGNPALGATQKGTLYAIESIRPAYITVTHPDGSTSSITIPALP